MRSRTWVLAKRSRDSELYQLELKDKEGLEVSPLSSLLVHLLMTESRGYVVNVRMTSELLLGLLDLVMAASQRRMFPGGLSSTPAVSRHRAGQEFVHEGDVGDGKSQRLDP